MTLTPSMETLTQVAITSNIEAKSIFLSWQTCCDVLPEVVCEGLPTFTFRFVVFVIVWLKLLWTVLVPAFSFPSLSFPPHCKEVLPASGGPDGSAFWELDHEFSPLPSLSSSVFTHGWSARLDGAQPHWRAMRGCGLKRGGAERNEASGVSVDETCHTGLEFDSGRIKGGATTKEDEKGPDVGLYAVVFVYAVVVHVGLPLYFVHLMITVTLYVCQIPPPSSLNYKLCENGHAHLNAGVSRLNYRSVRWLTP